MQALLLGATNEEWPTIIPLAMKRKLGIHLVSPIRSIPMPWRRRWRIVRCCRRRSRCGRCMGRSKNYTREVQIRLSVKWRLETVAPHAVWALEEGEAVTSLCWLEQHGFLVRGGESFVG